MGGPTIRILSEDPAGRIPPVVRAFMAACDALPDYGLETYQNICDAAPAKVSSMQPYLSHPEVVKRRLVFGRGAQSYCGNPKTIRHCIAKNWRPR